MLTPILPHALIPVTAQTDPPRVTPDIPPVAPVQASNGDANVDLRERDREEAELLLRDEQRRQQQREREEADEPDALYINAEDGLAVEPLIDDEPRTGLWIDLKV